MSRRRETGDRSLRAFLRAVREYPGFGLRVASALGFMIALTAAKGVETGIVTAACGVATGIVIGYPIWRRTGTRR